MPIRVRLFDAASGKIHSGGVRLISQAVANVRSSAWIDLQGVPVTDEQTLLNRTLALPMAAVRGFQCQQGPVLEERGGYVMLRLDELVNDADALAGEKAPIGFFFTQRYLITRHAEPSACIDLFWKDVGHMSAEDIHPSWIAVRLAGLIAGRYLTLLSTLGDYLDRANCSMSPPSKGQPILVEQRKCLSALCLALRDHSALFSALETLNVEFGDDIRARLLELDTNLRQALVIAESYRDQHG